MKPTTQRVQQVPGETVYEGEVWVVWDGRLTQVRSDQVRRLVMLSADYEQAQRDNYRSVEKLTMDSGGPDWYPPPPARIGPISLLHVRIADLTLNLRRLLDYLSEGKCVPWCRHMTEDGCSLLQESKN